MQENQTNLSSIEGRPGACDGGTSNAGDQTRDPAWVKGFAARTHIANKYGGGISRRWTPPPLRGVRVSSVSA
jgi:hypothetical protein